VQADKDKVRALISWSVAYRPEYDADPQRYVENGVVNWARSRRLGLLKLEAYKAYVGAQHIDPSIPGWNIVDRPEARFFVSFFVEGQCVALRTAPTMDGALEHLCDMLRSAGVRL